MFLAIDAGGTSTRAALVDVRGQCLGYGRAASGNPTSVGVEPATDAIERATVRALAQLADDRIERGPAVIAMAGEQTTVFVDRVGERLTRLGFTSVVLRPDLLGIFGSGSAEPDGYALIAGTGTVAARVVGRELERVVGGRGWLLGDAGGGYWIGQRIARAVVADLDGLGPSTALTGPLLNALGVREQRREPGGRQRMLRQLVSVLYADRPVRLARFAPLAFAAVQDPVAAAILRQAAAALSDLLAAVTVRGRPGPLVVGGSVAVRGLLAAPAAIRDQLVLPPENSGPIPVADGVVGACVLALRDAGHTVDHTLLRTLQDAVADRVVSSQSGPDPTSF